VTLVSLATSNGGLPSRLARWATAAGVRTPNSPCPSMDASDSLATVDQM